jgi:isopentenyl-diphosphate delta-isomerase
MPPSEHVILVDEQDHEIGTAEKLEAHQLNLCHRAFSVFIFRKKPTLELLIQQRANHKYHSGGLWTNTCCSHPRPGEDTLKAGERRLFEEMGIRASLTSLGWFHYIAPFANGLTENEIDYVLVGSITDEHFQTNPDEIQNYRWIPIEELQLEMQREPQRFTPWLAKALKKVTDNLSSI